MRKPIQLLFGALLPFAITLSLASCQRAELDMQVPDAEGPQKELREVIITAQAEDPAPLTRSETEVEQSGGTKSFPMYWLPGDKMMVYSAGEASEFVSINTTRARVAKFKGVISVISGADDGTEKDYVWAIYPSSAAVGYSEPNGNSATAVITADFPEVQESKAGSYADDIAMTIGRSESLGVYFKSVYSCLYFTFARNDIASITLKGRNNETLAGRINVTLVDNEPVATPVAGYESKEVTMYAQGGTFVPGQEYYMLFLPQTFAQGISLTVRRTDGQEGTYELRNQNLKLGRNVFTRLATPDSRVENQTNINNGTSTGWHASTTQGPNEIWYTTTDGTTLSFTPAQEEQFGIASCSDYGRIIFENDITEIPASFLENNTKLETISLPDGVVNVLNNAFRYCSNLKDVSFGNRLQKIHVSAFAFCDLQSLVLPEGLIEISSNAFDGNTSLRSVRLPSSLVLVGAVNSFTGCTGLTSFSGVSEASNPMWSISSDGRCLIDLSVSTYVQGVGRVTSPMLCSFATAGLDGQHYVLPDGITMISNGAMSKCTLKSIQLPATVTKIFDWAFGECTQLTNINIPPSVTYIGAYAFYGCSQLTNTNIPAGVTSLEPYTFYGCENLRQIGMDSAIPPTLGTNVFSNTNDTFVIAIPGAGDGNYHDSVNYPAWYALRDHFRIYQPNNEIWYHLVGDEASHINFGGSGDFGANLVEQREIYVPRNKVGPLVAIPTEVETGNDDSFSIAVCVFDDKITKVPSQAFSTEFWNSKLDWVSIPGTVTEIGERAFSGNSLLLDFPLSSDYVLTSIGADAFNGCSSMKYDYIRSTNIGVFQTVTTIGDRAFRGCASLKSFSAPGVTSLGESAFHYCEGLQFVDLRSLTVVKAQTFYHCDALEAIRTGELSSIGDHAFASCFALKDVGTNINDGIIQLPNITSLPQYAFYRCKKVEAIRLPNLTVAYGNAFGELGTSTTLQEFYVPKLANIIGLYVFGFIKMDELDLPSVTSIPKSTFGYSGIKTIRFGSSLSSFGGNNKSDMVFNSILTLPERNLYFEGTTPPTFGTYAFFTDYDVCSVLMPLTSIHVPVGCKEAYKTALHNANSSYDDYFSIIVDDITVQ